MTLQQAFLNVCAVVPAVDPQVKKRLDRGYDICINKGYSITKVSGSNGSSVYEVYRASTQLLEDNSVVYTVNSSGCSCPDAMSARAGLCKHRLAVMMLQEMSK